MPTLTEWRYAIRALYRARWFTATACAAFGLGIGVNVAIFGVVDRVLFQQLPFGSPDELVTIHPINARTGDPYFTLSKNIAISIKSEVDVIEDMAYAGLSRPYYPPESDTGSLRLFDASYNILSVLRVNPIIGRGFSKDDVLAKRRVALLREETWRQRFGGGSVVGSVFRHERGQFEIIGVLPAGFIPPSVNWATPSDGLLLVDDLLESAGPRSGVPAVFARLRPGKSLRTIQKQIDGIVARVETGPPDQRSRVIVEPIQAGLFWNCREGFSVLLAGGLLVWLIAFANLGVLILVRSASRELQFAVRASLGASSTAILRVVICEVALLCSAGTVLALLMFVWTIGAFRSILPSFVQSLVSTSLDLRLLVVAVAIAVAGAFVAACYPAWKATRVSPAVALQAKSPTPRRRRAARVLLIAESGICMVLVVAGVLANRSFVGLITTEIGFDPDRLFLVSFLNAPNSVDPRLTPGIAMELLRSMQGAEAVAFVDVAIASGEAPPQATDVDGRRFIKRRISPHYFAAMGTRVLAGRPFQDEDLTTSAPVAVISASAAELLFPGSDPATALGQRLTLLNDAQRDIVGVVADTRERHATPRQAELFVPGGQIERAPIFLLRTKEGAGDPNAQLDLALRGLAPSPRVSLTPVASKLEPWLKDPRLYAIIFGSFALIGFVLAIVGLAAVSRFDTQQRRSEISVRLALGASYGHVVRTIVVTTTLPVVVGVLVGAGFALLLAPQFQQLLFNTQVRDPLALTVVGGAMVMTSVVASWLPVRRQVKDDYLSALKVH